MLFFITYNAESYFILLNNRYLIFRGYHNAFSNEVFPALNSPTSGINNSALSFGDNELMSFFIESILRKSAISIKFLGCIVKYRISCVNTNEVDFIFIICIVNLKIVILIVTEEHILLDLQGIA